MLIKFISFILFGKSPSKFNVFFNQLLIESLALSFWASEPLTENQLFTSASGADFFISEILDPVPEPS